MTPKNVDDLRATLFTVIDAVRDGTLPLDRAKSIAELTQVVVNSAKVEVDFLKASNGKAATTGFLGRKEEKQLAAAITAELDTPPKEPEGDALPQGILGVTQHRIGDKEPNGE